MATKNISRKVFNTMEHHLYILTDINRTSLHVGTTHNLDDAVKTYRDMYALFFDANSRISRLVYRETFATEEETIKRFEEVSQYTRMQKERLIRRTNPDWVDISIVRPMRQKSKMLLFSQSKRQVQIA